MKEGYKKTEIGWIPEEWEIKSLGKVFKLSSGEFLSQKNIIDGPYPVYGGNGITGYHNKFKHKDSKIVIGRVGAKCGCVCRSIKESWITDNALYINEKLCEFNDEFMIYLLYYLDLNKFANQNAQPVISGQKIYAINIALPNLEEQEKIADILSTVDSQIDDTDKLIEKTKELKKGLMQRLLTKGIGHKEFKKTEVGEIPVEWEVKTIGEICELKGRIGWRGYTKEDLRDEGPLVVGATQISSNNKLDFSNPTYISIEKYDESPDIMVDLNDIILVKTGNTIGKVAIVDKNIGKATINPNTVLLKEVQCENKYLYYLIESQIVQKPLLMSITVGAQPSINQDRIKKIYVSIPKNNEQKKIVGILSSVDTQIEEYENKKIKLEELKKGLMQQLLTGRIRVKV